MTPARALVIAVVAMAPLLGARPGAEAQFPRGLLAAAPREKPDKGFCTIETRPLSFGTYDPEANAELDAVTQVRYTCDQHANKIRIEMTTGTGNQFTPRHMYATTTDSLDYNIYLDATHTTIWGQGLYGTDVYYQNNPPNGTLVIVPAYGRILARQDPPPGNYVDILTVRILF